MKNRSIILLSGGLDSLVSLGIAKEEYNVELAITFDYGQHSAEREIVASKEISDHYNIRHKVITLPFLRDVTNNALTNGDKELPKSNLGTKESAEAVWVPNRNGLFINIAATFADAEGYTHIIFGANKSEGITFPDNTPEFVSGINKSLEYSTLKGVKVVAPLIACDKIDIVKIALEKKIPLELVHSCYSDKAKNCGECESCRHLKSALEANKAQDYIERLF